MPIPLPYRLFHLYIEPLILIPGGIYLSLFQPSQFLYTTTPLPISSPYAPPSPAIAKLTGHATPPPLALFLLQNTAALYAMFGLSELLVLRTAESFNAKDQVAVWRALITAILVCDGGHVAALAWAMGGLGSFVDWNNWRQEDWINIVILAVGIILRAGFLLGAGMGGYRRGKGKRA